jgi:hypothetical protein
LFLKLKAELTLFFAANVALQVPQRTLAAKAPGKD